MKISLCILSVLTVCFFLLSQNATAEDLTPEQRESLQRRLLQIKTSLEEHVSTRNQGARGIFLRASGDAKSAVALYLECVKRVNYDLEGRSDAEFRAWKDNNEGRFKDDRFVNSLMIVLRYLALSCHAAEVEKLDEVFPALTSYVEGLSQLKELPDQMLTSALAGSVFVKAYDLENLLSQNRNWENVPFNIPGIYDKIILPYLRENKPESLMGAWDRRIEQETRLVTFFDEMKQQELRGLDRDEKIKRLDNQANRGGIMRSHDKDYFVRETLPLLRWSKMKDMYKYVNEFDAARQMLAFVEENLKSKRGESYYNELIQVISGSNDNAPNPFNEVGL